MSGGALRILHVITWLGPGGAENMLFKLLSAMDRARFESRVASLTTDGVIGERIRSLGIETSILGMRRGVPSPSGVVRLARLVRRWQPHVVQTWMYHADLIGGIAAKLGAPGTPVVWGLRNSDLDPSTVRRTTLWTVRACGALSGTIPLRIVSCSRAACAIHERLGYARDKMIVIPNGFDLSKFRPDGDARAAIRAELGIPPAAPLIGMLARFDAQKDHANFLRAAADLRARIPEAHFLLAGAGVDGENRRLRELAHENCVADRVHLLGLRLDVQRIQAALDVATLSSAYGEAFPNTVGEAMACAVPCVVTDVGDSSAIVGDTGRTVPPRNATALAAAWAEILSLPPDQRSALGGRARRRVESEFSLPTVAARYSQLYQEVGTRPGR
jgi:glycosyltransferase involved in cell wall biosynthesis